jgi:hypothetical protein
VFEVEIVERRRDEREFLVDLDRVEPSERQPEQVHAVGMVEQVGARTLSRQLLGVTSQPRVRQPHLVEVEPTGTTTTQRDADPHTRISRDGP